MGLVATWLNGIGLSHAIPAFKAAGIVTPAALAELDVAHYEALGVKDAADRRKLFYLVQRIKMASEDQQGDDQEQTEQEKIDAVLQQTMPSTDKKLVLYKEDDSLDEEEQESPEPVKRRTRASTRKSSGVSTRQSTSSLSAHLSSTKENKELNQGSKVGTRSRTRASTSRSGAKTETPPEMDEDISGVSKDDSDWEEDSLLGADDEASSSHRRTSRRLKEKRMHSMESGSSVGSLVEEDEESSAPEEKKEIRRSLLARQPSGTGYSGDAESTRRRTSAGRTRRPSTSDLDADDESSIKEAAPRKPGIQAPKSGVQAPASRPRRFESNLQKPTRTGKGLSTIPSDAVAPMSPLVELPVSHLEADITNQQKMDRKQKTNALSGRHIVRSLSYGDGMSSDTSEKDSKSRKRSSAESGSDSEVQNGRNSSRGRRGVSNSGSDPEVETRRRSTRRSVGTERDSEIRRSGLSSESETDNARSRGRGVASGSDSETQVSRPSRLSTGGISKRNGAQGRTRKSTSVLEQQKSGAVFVHGTAEDTSWFAQVSRLQEENQAEHELFHGHTIDADDEEMRIRVLVRKRPMSNSEAKATKDVDVIHPLDYDGYGRVLVYQPKTRVDLTREVETVSFAFDNVFDEQSTNEDIYKKCVRNLIPGVFDEGKWASVFAYGQTGSGKTFTMMGCNVTGINAGTANDDMSNYGLYYMAALDVFEMAAMDEFQHMSIGVSLFEIYGGKLFDLLNNRNQVKCLEDHRGKVCFPGLSERPVYDADEVMQVIESGAANRSTGKTSKNADSSRSHAIMQLCVRKKIGRKENVEHGRLTFIDLAGSERGADTANASRATRLEGAEINTSLLALKEVIRALATGDSMSHIPFRGSKLTQVLKESFVGINANSVMVACIAPNMSNCEHTLNTLRYADRVKERNATTGALSVSASKSRGRKSSTTRLSRLSNAPEKPKSVDDDDDEDDGYLVDQKRAFEQVASPDSNFYSCHSSDLLGSQSFPDEYDDDEDLLVDTDTETHEPPPDPRVIMSPMSRDVSSDGLLDELLLTSEKEPPPSGMKSQIEAGATDALISTHRSVMSQMLRMCKEEMSLANNADADRDSIDSYLNELGSMHEKQCEMLADLHEKLLQFRQSRAFSSQSVEIVSEDDSFEDLRD